MPTFSQNLPLIPTEYVPIDYSHDAQFALVEAQQAAQNIAKVKSRYEDLLGMDLTNDKSKETLSTFMKSAEEDLRKVSGMDMLVSSNATEALGILKPLTQLEGPYGFIVVDNVFTKKYNNGKSQAGFAKVKGENYNQAADDYLDIQKKRFQNTDNIDQWKYILNNTDDYTPYYDTQKELMDLVSKFKPNSIEADQAGGGKIVTTKDQSVYASTLQDFLEANLSDKYKAQKDLEAKVNFGKQQLLSYNPETKMYDGNKVYSYYDKLLTDIKTNRTNIYNQEKNALQKEVTLLSNTSEGLKQQTELRKRIANIDAAIKRTNDETLDKNLFSNANDYRKAEAIAMNILGMKDLTDKAQSLAHLDISITQKADDAYWKKLDFALAKEKFEYQKRNDEENRKWDLQKEMIKAGLKHLDKDGNVVDGGNNYSPQPITDMSQGKYKNNADRGLHKIDNIMENVKSTLGTAGLSFIDSHFKSAGFKAAKQAMEKEPAKFAGKTWGQITSGPFVSLGQANSPLFNQFLLSSAQKMMGLNNYGVALGKNKYVGGAKIIDIKDGGTTTRLTTDKGIYILDKKSNKVYDLSGNIIDNNFNKFTQEDLNRLPYEQVMQLAINSVNAPTAREVLKTSLPAYDYTKADIELQMAESNQDKLHSRLRESLIGTPFENIDIDISRINDKDYMEQKYINAKGIKINNALSPYAKQQSEAMNKLSFDEALQKVYQNFDDNSSDLTPYEMEQKAAVPVLVAAKDRAGNQSIKDQWDAYANNNLNIVRGSLDPMKKITGLVNDFPEAFIPVRDAKGYRFELNGAYIESVMTDIDKKRLFNRLDQTVGKSDNWFVGTFTDNITDASEAVDALNEYVSEKDPDFFRVNVKNYDDSEFRNDQSALSLVTGGGFTLRTNIPTGYEDINVNPLSLSMQNFGAATLEDARLNLQGQMVLPKISSDGKIQRDGSGAVSVYTKEASTLNYSDAQLLAKGKEIMTTVGGLSNAWSAIIDKLNSSKYTYINDLYQDAINDQDYITLMNLQTVGLLQNK